RPQSWLQCAMWPCAMCNVGPVRGMLRRTRLLKGTPPMLTAAFTIQKMLLGMKQHSASDLHIKPGVTPTYRINGILRALGTGPLDPEEADHLLDPIVPDKLRSKF